MQKLFEDKITTLTSSGGNINMPAGARLTIGGQQYSTSSQLSVPVNVDLANTRYQVYAILSGSAVQLVISQNENSVGPAGQSIWKLVGSYYTDGLDSTGFGSFVTITGTPKTNRIDFVPFVDTSTANKTNSGSGGNQVQIGDWARDGDKLRAKFILRYGNAGTAAGTGAYELVLMGYNRQPENSSSFTYLGAGHLFDSNTATSYPMLAAAFDGLATDRIRFQTSSGAGGATTFTSAFPISIAQDDLYKFDFEVSIQEWSNTPIEDL